VHGPLRRCSGAIRAWRIPTRRQCQTSACGMRAIVSSLRRNAFSQLRAYESPPFHALRAISLHGRCLHHVPRTLRIPKQRLYHTSHEEPTIYALSTASGRAAIAVIRVSGSACRQVRVTSLQTIPMLTFCRYMKDYAPLRPFLSLVMRPCASYTPLIYLLPPKRY
jgi:hypothetical protein